MCSDNHRRRVWRRPGLRADPAFIIARHRSYGGVITTRSYEPFYWSKEKPLIGSKEKPLIGSKEKPLIGSKEKPLIESKGKSYEVDEKLRLGGEEKGEAESGALRGISLAAVSDCFGSGLVVLETSRNLL
ncbi:hypothetical protein TNCV_4367161 [Trichonephila clavipes]|nr:hypothetical protein TNCV_4367161 [Trichonephila clavipes]